MAPIVNQHAQVDEPKAATRDIMRPDLRCKVYPPPTPCGSCADRMREDGSNISLGITLPPAEEPMIQRPNMPKPCQVYPPPAKTCIYCDPNFYEKI